MVELSCSSTRSDRVSVTGAGVVDVLQRRLSRRVSDVRACSRQHSCYRWGSTTGDYTQQRVQAQSCMQRSACVAMGRACSVWPTGQCSPTARSAGAPAAGRTRHVPGSRVCETWSLRRWRRRWRPRLPSWPVRALPSGLVLPRSRCSGRGGSTSSCSMQPSHHTVPFLAVKEVRVRTPYQSR